MKRDLYRFGDRLFPLSIQALAQIWWKFAEIPVTLARKSTRWFHDWKCCRIFSIRVCVRSFRWIVQVSRSVFKSLLGVEVPISFVFYFEFNTRLQLFLSSSPYLFFLTKLFFPNSLMLVGLHGWQRLNIIFTRTINATVVC